MTVKALILCAGQGTRLRELTCDCPKPLLPVNGKPLVAYTLELLARHGIRDVAINLHYLAERFPPVLGDGARFGLNIHYEIEDAMLGTAGALANLTGYFRDATDVLVVYGDLLFDEDLTAFHARHQATGADVTLLLHRRATTPQSVVDLDENTGRIIRFRERPNDWVSNQTVWVNSGCQLLRQGLIERFPARRPLDLPRDIYMPMASELALYGAPITGYRIAVDSPERYEQANRDVSSGKWDSSVAGAVQDPS